MRKLERTGLVVKCKNQVSLTKILRGISIMENQTSKEIKISDTIKVSDFEDYLIITKLGFPSDYLTKIKFRDDEIIVGNTTRVWLGEGDMIVIAVEERTTSKSGRRSLICRQRDGNFTEIVKFWCGEPDKKPIEKTDSYKLCALIASKINEQYGLNWECRDFRDINEEYIPFYFLISFAGLVLFIAAIFYFVFN